MKQVGVVLAGLGGYGRHYVEQLLGASAQPDVQFVAGVDPVPEKSPFLEELKRSSIPIYPDLESFYSDAEADLVVICTGIHLHAALCSLALCRGSHVLCEKPLCATTQQAYEIDRAVAAADRFVAVGYQWSFSTAIQAFKRDVLSGVLGRPLRLRTRVLWPRSESYYARNNWAGRIKTVSGEWVPDSPAHNAAAHYLHNMLYLLGKTRETSAWPVDVQAELYRANRIENYDAVALRCHTEEGAEILFYGAHCAVPEMGPDCQFEFEKAVVTYEAGVTEGFTAQFHDGTFKHYGDPNASDAHKLWESVTAVRTGQPVACGIQAAMPQVLSINGAQESAAITQFPDALIKRQVDDGGDGLVWVEGLGEALTRCYEQGILPAESREFSWAQSGRVVSLRGYRYFPSTSP